MSSIRIYEIAKRNNLSSGDVVKICLSLGIKVKNYMSSIDSEQEEKILKVISKKSKKPEAKSKAKKTKLELKVKPKASSKIKVKVVNKGEAKAKTRVKTRDKPGTKLKMKPGGKTKLKTKLESKARQTKLKIKAKLKTKLKPKIKTKAKVKAAKSEIKPEAELKTKIETKLEVETEEKPKWEEEKEIKIRKVLDKELDREEKEGGARGRIIQRKKKAIYGKETKIKQKLKENVKGKKVEKAAKEKPVIKKVIELPEVITVKQLSERINIQSSEIIQTLFNIGEIVSINQTLDKDLIELLSHEYNFKYNIIGFKKKLDEIYKDLEEDLVKRSPIVTVMGHVDHGKTTLLDAIRETKVAMSETGGITQHIGAYQVEYNKGKITFVDTPGHEAFTAMRARGAKVTDIAVIVIAADDGIMPQTIEAINHAKDAGVPIIVAINKIDLPDSDSEKIKKGLTEYSLVPEEWGGDTICVEISAKNKTNIDELLEMILLVADMNELKGNPDVEGSGIIIESRLDKGMGPVGTVIVKRGIIRIGDFFVTGNSCGRVRSIKDQEGKSIKKAGLSKPVEISGFSIVPQAGDKFFIVKNERVAKELMSRKNYDDKISKMAGSRRHITLEELSEISKKEEIKKLKIVMKADANGSLDAVEQALRKIEEDKIKIDIIHEAVGAVSDSDILLASASNAIVIGFGVVPTTKAKALAKEERVEIKTYNIIYKLIDDVKLAFKGLLEPKIQKIEKGKIEVRETFKMPKVGVIAGCYVTEGEVGRNDIARVVRDGKIVHEGKVSSLHRYKQDVKKVAAGYECGIRIENYQDINKGDVIEVYEEKEILK